MPLKKSKDPIGAMKREAANLSARDKEVVNRGYLEELARIEKAALEAKQQKEKVAAELKKEVEAFDINCNLVTSALIACRKTGELELVQKVRDRGKQTWELFCLHCLPLELAIRHEKPKVVEFLLDNGVNYTARTLADITPCEYAITYPLEKCSEPKKEIFRVMVSRILKDVPPKSENGELDWFHKALGYPEKAIANNLLNSPIPESDGVTPPMVFAIHNRLNTLMFIDNNGYFIDFQRKDENGKTLFDHAFELGHKELIKWVCLKTKMALSPLEKFCQQEKAEPKEIEPLLKLVFSEEQYNNALIWATLNGHDVIVEKLILTKKVDVQVRDNVALIIAVRFKYPKIVRLLMTAGANPIARDLLSIKFAVSTEQKEVVDCLINQPNHIGQTALHRVCECTGDDDTSKVQFLLERGANINAKMEGGKTPLYFAFSYGLYHIFDFLKLKGADTSSINDDLRIFNMLLDLSKFRLIYRIDVKIENGEDHIKLLKKEQELEDRGIQLHDIKGQAELMQSKNRYILSKIRELIKSTNENDYSSLTIKDKMLDYLKQISNSFTEKMLGETYCPLHLALVMNKPKLALEIINFGGVFGNVKVKDKSGLTAYEIWLKCINSLLNNEALKEAIHRQIQPQLAIKGDVVKAVAVGAPPIVVYFDAKLAKEAQAQQAGAVVIGDKVKAKA